MVSQRAASACTCVATLHMAPANPQTKTCNPQVKVKRRGSDKKYVANVLAVGTECDIGERWTGGSKRTRQPLQLARVSQCNMTCGLPAVAVYLAAAAALCCHRPSGLHSTPEIRLMDTHASSSLLPPDPFRVLAAPPAFLLATFRFPTFFLATCWRLTAHLPPLLPPPPQRC